MHFSEAMNFDEEGVDYSKQVNITIPDIMYTYNISYIDNKTLLLEFDYKETVEDKTATLSFNTSGYYFSSVEGARMESYKAVVFLDDFIYYTDGEKMYVKVCYYICYAGCLIGILCCYHLFVGNSLIRFWNWFLYLQFFNIIVFFNMKLPWNMLRFAQALQFTNF